MTPLQRLINQRELIDLVMIHGYMPQRSNANFGEVLSALRELDPNIKLDPGCSGCVMDIIRTADRIIKNQ